MGKTVKRAITLGMALFLVLAVACTPSEAELVKGILENVDAVNGEITIVTKDGKTVTLKIATETEVQADGASSALEILEPGASVEAEVKKDKQVVQRLNAHQARVEGTVMELKGNEVTVEAEDGKRVIVLVINGTRIELEDGATGSLTDLRVGAEVEIKFDPSSRIAFKIEVAAEAKEVIEKERKVGQGTIEIRVTDPPPANVTSAVVYLSGIEVHRIADNVSEWVTIIGAPQSFDLMSVIGVEKILGSANVTAGKYTQIRLSVDRVEVVTVAGDNITAEVPGEKLKIIRSFTVEPDVTTVLTLDFDGEKSLVLPGKDIAASKPRVLFKPVIKLEVETGKGKAEDKEVRKLEFQGAIQTIAGTTWTMTINGEIRTVDVSGAEIEGEPAVGLQAEVKGTVTDDSTILASEVEIKKG